MSLKRKLGANGAPSSSSAPAPKVQLSAFAAAKVKSSIADLDDAEDSIIDSDREDYTTSRQTSVSGGIGPLEDEGDDVDHVDRVTEEAHFRNVQLSTWKLTEDSQTRVSCTESSINIELLPGETIALIGSYDLLVSFGAVLLYGAILTASTKLYRVYAPASHALPVIEGNSAGKAKIKISVVKNGLRSMARLSPLFKRLWNKDRDVREDIKFLSKQSCQLLQSATDDSDRRLLYGLAQPQDWRDSIRCVAISSSKTSARVLVTGFNGSGKSTYARLLTNILLTRPDAARTNSKRGVCWLDLDPAHPEFSPPGQLSLVHVTEPILGPAYTHSYVDNAIGFAMIRAHNIATITVKDDPAQYLACAQNLFHYYEANHSEATLIINCPKWAVGEGLETLLELIKALPCTDLVFMLKGQAPEEQYTRALPEVRQDTAIQHAQSTSMRQPMELVTMVLDTVRKSGKNTTTIHYLSKVNRPSLAFRTAADFRHMQTMSYFQSLDPAHGRSAWDSSGLLARSPWLASYDQESPEILGILSIGAQTTADNLSTAMDGMVLGLCVLEDDDEAEYAFSRLERTPNEGLPYWPPGVALTSAPPTPSHSHAIGFVYCQAINHQSRSLVLQTPIPRHVLTAASLKTRNGVPKLFLVRGSLDMPAWAYLELDHMRRPVGTNEIKQRLTLESSKNAKRKREADLTQNLRALNPGYDVARREPGEGNKVVEDVDANGKHVIPYVAEVGEGDNTGQRWRTRHDIGRR